MVTHINFAVDDHLAERAKDLKNDLDLSWAELLEQATDCLEAQRDGENA